MHLEHEHDCGHTHDHPHTHEPEHAHDHSHTAAPRDELIALMRYMVGHNVSHTNELKELAHKLAHTGDSEACANTRRSPGLRNRQSETRSKSGSASEMNGFR